jgi:5'-nucleotidase
MLDELPDMVVSGINLGANMGDDTIYSGTVAAATEGFLLGVPSIAVSLCSRSPVHFETAAQVALEVVQMVLRQNSREPLLLNVNVPDVPYDQLRGMVVTRLGKRHKAEAVIRSLTPRQETVYWVGAAGAAQDAGEGTDFYAVSQNQVSITPLQIDLTHNAQMPMVRQWLAQ